MEWEVEQLRDSADHFTVARPADSTEVAPRRPGARLAFEVTRVETLDEALALAVEIGRDEHGRTPLVYGVTRSGMTIHVDERHLAALRGGER